MKIRHAVLAAAAAAALAIGVAAPALAQDDPPAPSCAEALTAFNAAQAALDALPATVPNPELPDLQAAVAEARAAVDAVLPPVITHSPNVYPSDIVPALADVDEALLRAILDDPDLGGDARVQVQAAFDAVLALDAAQAALDAATDEVVNPALEAATEARDEAKAAADNACRGPAGPPATPNDDDQGDQGGSTDGPAVDYDCADFPLADGTTAQDVLAADPSDPHLLDKDRDKIACDLDDATSGSYTQVTELPTAIDTGRA